MFGDYLRKKQNPLQAGAAPAPGFRDFMATKAPAPAPTAPRPQSYAQALNFGGGSDLRPALDRTPGATAAPQPRGRGIVAPQGQPSVAERFAEFQRRRAMERGRGSSPAGMVSAGTQIARPVGPQR